MKRDLATPLAPTPVSSIQGDPKKKKKKRPPTQPKGTWYNADDDTSNAPWTTPTLGDYPVVTSTSYSK
ncbi:MAG TPA: hypothetical protein EYO58_06150 [Flavobacteriales bacterium]|nr:hypothetical protein [Flavobacteriales bacterium]HIB77193.1 hypothetical protein [Flavobacteriales bacterium]